jgi:hypothetical protein
MASGAVLAGHLKTLDYMVKNENLEQSDRDMFIAVRLLRTIARSLLKTPLRSNSHDLEQVKRLLLTLNNSLVATVYADVVVYMASPEYRRHTRRKHTTPMWWLNRSIESYMPTNETIANNKALRDYINAKPLSHHIPDKLLMYDSPCTLKTADEWAYTELQRKQRLAQKQLPNVTTHTLHIDLGNCTIELQLADGSDWKFQTNSQFAHRSYKVDHMHDYDVITVTAWSATDTTTNSPMGFVLTTVTSVDGSRTNEPTQLEIVCNHQTVARGKIPADIVLCNIQNY